MNVFTKVLVVLVLLLSAALAGSQMVLHAKRAEYQQLYAKTDADLKLEKQRSAKLEAERNDVTRERDGINLLLDAERASRKADKDRLETEVIKLSGDLSKLQEDLRRASAQVSTMVTIVETQVAHIAELEKANYEFKDAVRVADAAIKTLQDDIRARDGSIQALNADVEQLRGKMKDVTAERDYLAAAVAHAKSQGFDVLAENVPIIDAKVLNVDPTISAVVLNKGSDDGVKVNFPLTISRGSEYVAKVTVVEVHPELSVARVVPGFEEKPIERGDDASTRR
jgi:cell shape-determining protein MreC